MSMDNPDAVIKTATNCLTNPGVYKSWLGYVYNQRGFAYEKKDLYQQALADYDSSINNRSGSTTTIANRARLLFKMENYKRAYSDYARLITLGKKKHDGYFGRGKCKRMLEDFKGCIADFDQAIAMKPTADAYNWRGVCKEKLKKFPEAIADYRKSISMDSKRSVTYANLCYALNETGDRDGAIAACDKSIALKPDYARAYNLRGYAREKKGDSKGALADYKKALEIRPDYKLAMKNMARVSKK